MKRVVIVGKGGPEQLQVREAPDTEPNHGEVRIRVRASRINFADIPHHRSAGREEREEGLQRPSLGGRLGMFGISAATASRLPGPLRLARVALGMPFFHPVSLMNSNRSVFGVNLGHMWHETDMIADWMRVLLDAVAEGWVRPHVDRTFPLEDAGAAHAYIEERRNTGKVVLTT